MKHLLQIIVFNSNWFYEFALKMKHLYEKDSLKKIQSCLDTSTYSHFYHDVLKLTNDIPSTHMLVWPMNLMHAKTVILTYCAKQLMYFAMG